MAENGVTLNLGSGGKTVDTETSPSSGFEMQRVKLALGAVGSDSGDLALGQAAKAASLPVTLASDQGALGVSWSGQSVSVTGSVAVTGTFWQTTQPVSLASLPALAAGANVIGSVSQNGAWTVSVTSEVGVGSTGAAVPATAQYAGINVGGNLTGMTGTANGLKVDGSAVTQPVSLASLPALATGANAIGSITNASFGISGTLPAFAATPTVNLGALNGAATAANQASLLAAVGSPFQAGGSVGVNNVAVGPASFATSQASITTTSSGAALAARTGAAGTGRVSVTIYNVGAQTAYLGTSTGVTSSTGLPILPGGSYTKRTTAALYAVTASGSTTLAFDEEF